MRIVAIETATAASSIALGDESGVVASARRRRSSRPCRVPRPGARLLLRPGGMDAQPTSTWWPSTSDPGCSAGSAPVWPPPRPWPGAVGVPSGPGVLARRDRPAGRHRAPTDLVGGRRPPRRGGGRTVPAGARRGGAGRARRVVLPRGVPGDAGVRSGGRTGGRRLAGAAGGDPARSARHARRAAPGTRRQTRCSRSPGGGPRRAMSPIPTRCVPATCANRTSPSTGRTSARRGRGP